MAVALSENLPSIAAPRQRASPRELRFHLLVLVGSLLLGAALQLFGPSWLGGVFERVRLDSAAGVASLILALLAAIAVHELGHLVSALFLNFEILGCALGPFRYQRQRHETTLRFSREDWFRCSISAVPLEIRNAWRFRTMTVVASGPALTLAFLLLAVPGALHEGDLVQFWSACVEVNFFLFVMGLIPNSRGSKARNDAALFRALCENGADARDIFTGHRAIELTLRGTRPEDYPEKLMLDLASAEGRPYTNLLVAQRMVEWAVDSGDEAMADNWDQYALRMSEQCGPREFNAALAESACFDVLFRRNFRAARSKFARVNFEELLPLALAERSSAARLIACDLPHWAPYHILRAQYLLPLGKPYFEYERMLLGKLHLQALSYCPPSLRLELCGDVVVSSQVEI